jgi:hypothetical protein
MKVSGQAQDVRMRVDQHGGAPPALATPDLSAVSGAMTPETADKCPGLMTIIRAPADAMM